jgi:hypothetical protein
MHEVLTVFGIIELIEYKPLRIVDESLLHMPVDISKQPKLPALLHVPLSIHVEFDSPSTLF